MAASPTLATADQIVAFMEAFDPAASGDHVISAGPSLP